MAKEKILVVDDEKEIAELVEIYLSGEGFEVYPAGSAEEGLRILDRQAIDLIILDIMMPGTNGIEMCRRVREKRNLPIIFLSAKSTDLDKILGLNVGADDYMTKPFSPLELSARVKAQLRRFKELNSGSEKDEDIISIRDVVINKKRHQVLVDGEEIRLTPLEFDILYLLASHRGRVFGTDEIFELVWHEHVYEANNTVMVHIRRLRSKLHDDRRTDKIISTVWGVGYKIEK